MEAAIPVKIPLPEAMWGRASGLNLLAPHVASNLNVGYQIGDFFNVVYCMVHYVLVSALPTTVIVFEVQPITSDKRLANPCHSRSPVALTSLGGKKIATAHVEGRKRSACCRIHLVCLRSTCSTKWSCDIHVQLGFCESYEHVHNLHGTYTCLRLPQDPTVSSYAVVQTQP